MLNIHDLLLYSTDMFVHLKNLPLYLFLLVLTLVSLYYSVCIYVFFKPNVNMTRHSWASQTSHPIMGCWLKCYSCSIQASINFWRYLAPSTGNLLTTDFLHSSLCTQNWWATNSVTVIKVGLACTCYSTNVEALYGSSFLFICFCSEERCPAWSWRTSNFIFIRLVGSRFSWVECRIDPSCQDGANDPH